MAVFDGLKGIGVASGFKLQAASPLDLRESVQSIEDRNALVTENGAWEGMKVYVKDTQTTYELKGTTNDDWAAIGGDTAAELSALQTQVSDLETNTKGAFVDFVVDAKTGVFTFTKVDGTTEEVDTLLEKVTVNFAYNEETDKLELTLEDGTVQSVDLSKFVDVFTGVDGTTVEVAVSADNKISAEVKDGAITTAKLADEVTALLDKIVDGTTSQKGIVQLSDTVENDSTKAATPTAVNAVKAIADQAALDASGAKTSAEAAVAEAEAATAEAAAAKGEAAAATTEATAAKTSASEATATANTAKATAESAQGTAEGAASTAATAKATAESAASDAEAANTAAATAQETADSKVKVIWVEKGESVPATAEANSLCFSIL